MSHVQDIRMSPSASQSRQRCRQRRGIHLERHFKQPANARRTFLARVQEPPGLHCSDDRLGINMHDAAISGSLCFKLGTVGSALRYPTGHLLDQIRPGTPSSANTGHCLIADGALWASFRSKIVPTSSARTGSTSIILGVASRTAGDVQHTRNCHDNESAR
jgi:hypothetical protein